MLANIHRALRADGTFLMIDINASSRLEDNVELPWASLLYVISTVHCMSVSLGQGGAGLGAVWGYKPPSGCWPRPDSPTYAGTSSSRTRSTPTSFARA